MGWAWVQKHGPAGAIFLENNPPAGVMRPLDQQLQGMLTQVGQRGCHSPRTTA